MNYKDLQNKAKELGLPYVGVPRIEIEKNINEKLGIEDPPTPPESQPEKPLVVEKPVIIEQPVEEIKEEPKKRGPKPKQVKPDLDVKEDKSEDSNTATIYDGSFKVRSYTLLTHGEKFHELAMSFVSDKPKYRIVFTNELPNLTCKNCGAKIRCSTCGKDVS